MDPQSTPVASSAPKTLPTPYLLCLFYGVASLALLWSSGGGDFGLIAGRSWIFALIMAACAAGALKWEQSRETSGSSLLEQLRHPTPRKVAVGWGAALAIYLPLLVAFMVLLSSKSPWLASSQGFLHAFKPDSWLAIIAWSFIAAPAAEILVRGCFVPVWGPGWIAFLEALTVGFAFQHVLPFGLSWAWGWIGFFIVRTHGIGPAALARALLCFLLLSTLKTLGA
jgi:hypothetical protein